MTRAIPFLETPLILAPIAGPGSPELTAAAANAGAFPFLACAYSDAATMRAEIARVRELTSKPFGINLFIEQPLPAVTPGALAAANERLNIYRDELAIPHPASPASPPQRYREQLSIVVEAQPAAFSFAFGIPSAEEIATLRAAGIYTIGTATCAQEAIALEAAGIDAVFAQGAEAGGHRGSFLHPDDPPLIGTVALVRHIVAAVKVPVIAAGGIVDGRSVAAVLLLGATAAALGTAFLLAPEARTAPAYREALASASSADTVVTRAFSGRAARGIKNRLTRELADPGARAPYPFQNALTRDIRNAAAKAGRAEYLSLWAGQAFPLARQEPAAAIVERVLREMREALDSTASLGR